MILLIKHRDPLRLKNWHFFFLKVKILIKSKSSTRDGRKEKGRKCQLFINPSLLGIKTIIGSLILYSWCARERSSQRWGRSISVSHTAGDTAKGWSTKRQRRRGGGEEARKGLKPLRTLSRGTRHAGFGPNEKASAEKRARGARHSRDVCGALVSP